MTSKEFVKAKEKLGIDNTSMAKLLGYFRVNTVREICDGSRKVPTLVDNFLTVLLALDETGQKLVIGHILSGKKGKLTLGRF